MERPRWVDVVVKMRQFTVSEKVVVCDSDPDVAVTVIIDVTG